MKNPSLALLPFISTNDSATVSGVWMYGGIVIYLMCVQACINERVCACVQGIKTFTSMPPFCRRAATAWVLNRSENFKRYCKTKRHAGNSRGGFRVCVASAGWLDIKFQRFVESVVKSGDFWMNWKLWKKPSGFDEGGAVFLSKRGRDLFSRFVEGVDK